MSKGIGILLENKELYFPLRDVYVHIHKHIFDHTGIRMYKTEDP